MPKLKQSKDSYDRNTLYQLGDIEMFLQCSKKIFYLILNFVYDRIYCMSLIMKDLLHEFNHEIFV